MNTEPPKITSELIMATAICLVGLVAIGDFIMLLTYSSQTQQAVLFLYSTINQSGSNDTFQLETNGHLAYLQQSIYAVSQSVNLTSQGSLQEINSLKESNKNLQNRLDTLNKTVMNFNCTSTNTTIIYNNTVQVQNITTTTPDNRTCREKLLNLHGLGPLFDIVYCCESRTYGFADECCECYR